MAQLAAAMLAGVRVAAASTPGIVSMLLAGHGSWMKVCRAAHLLPVAWVEQQLLHQWRAVLLCRGGHVAVHLRPVAVVVRLHVCEQHGALLRVARLQHAVQQLSAAAQTSSIGVQLGYEQVYAGRTSP
jgi:hypothetical protein